MIFKIFIEYSIFNDSISLIKNYISKGIHYELY